MGDRVSPTQVASHCWERNVLHQAGKLEVPCKHQAGFRGRCGRCETEEWADEVWSSWDSSGGLPRSATRQPAG